MLKTGEAGIATAAAVVAVLAVAGGVIGGPLAVDTFADQQPDSPLYALERAGERIKEKTYAKGQGWDLERAKERVKEYAHIADKEIPHNHAKLLSEAGDRVMNAARSAKDVKGLERAREAAGHNAQVLQRVMEKKSEQANSAVQKALTRIQLQERAIGQVREKLGAGGITPGHLKQELENSMMEIENVIKTLESQEWIPPGILKEIVENRGLSLENLENILESRWLPPGIFKEIVENREIDFENLKELIKDRKISPGILQQLLENREISLENLKQFLQEKQLPVGIAKNILENRGFSEENIENILDNLSVPGNIPNNDRLPENPSQQGNGSQN